MSWATCVTRLISRALVTGLQTNNCLILGQFRDFSTTSITGAITFTTNGGDNSKNSSTLEVIPEDPSKCDSENIPDSTTATTITQQQIQQRRASEMCRALDSRWQGFGPIGK